MPTTATAFPILDAYIKAKKKGRLKELYKKYHLQHKQLFDCGYCGQTPCKETQK